MVCVSVCELSVCCNCCILVMLFLMNLLVICLGCRFDELVLIMLCSCRLYVCFGVICCVSFLWNSCCILENLEKLKCFVKCMMVDGCML